MELQEITEDSKIGIKAASLVVVVVFVFSTAIPVGILFSQQAEAGNKLKEHDDEIRAINQDRANKREDYNKTLIEINQRLTRIETKLEK